MMTRAATDFEGAGGIICSQQNCNRLWVAIPR